MYEGGILMSSPTELYNIDFDDIKQNIKKEYSNTKDYGSSIIIDCTKSCVDVFCDGRIKILGDKCIEANQVVNRVKDIFKNQINELNYDDDPDPDRVEAISAAAMAYNDEYIGVYDQILNGDMLIKRINERASSDNKEGKKAVYRKVNNEI